MSASSTTKPTGPGLWPGLNSGVETFVEPVPDNHDNRVTTLGLGIGLARFHVLKVLLPVVVLVGGFGVLIFPVLSARP